MVCAGPTTSRAWERVHNESSKVRPLDANNRFGGGHCRLRRIAGADFLTRGSPGSYFSRRCAYCYLHASALARKESSWMSSHAASQNLLYVSEVRTVAVYSYPQLKLEGTLRHFYIASGMCVDKGGDVFVVDGGYGKIFEYAHGGTKRLVTLDSPTKGPVGCSIDPTTGDLAVGSQGFGTEATVAIYKNARGKPVTYTDSAFDQFFFCGYDNKGNLFADGLTAPGSGNFALAELPQGKTALTTITVDQYVIFPGGVQWDGKHLAIGNQFTDIYEFAISGHHATTVGTTSSVVARCMSSSSGSRARQSLHQTCTSKSAQLLTSSSTPIRPAARPLRRLRTASRVHKVRL